MVITPFIYLFLFIYFFDFLHISNKTKNIQRITS